MACEICPDKTCKFVKNDKGREEKPTDYETCLPEYIPGECDTRNRQKKLEDFLSNPFIPI